MEINKINALADATVLHLLKSNKGAQVYVLPEETDLKSYKSLIIHCEEYTKLLGGTSHGNERRDIHVVWFMEYVPGNRPNGKLSITNCTLHDLTPSSE